MTQEDFIEILDRENYSYYMEGDNIVVNHERGNEAGVYGVHLVASRIEDEDGGYFDIIDSIPAGVIFKNKGILNLSSLENIPDGVEFRNTGELKLDNISTSEIPLGFIFGNTGSINFSNRYWDHEWSGNIEGINDKRLMNMMIKQGLF